MARSRHGDTDWYSRLWLFRHFVLEREREEERETERERERQTDRQRERDRDRQTDRLVLSSRKLHLQLSKSTV